MSTRGASEAVGPASSLGDKQRLFAKLVGELLHRIYDEGYEVTFGDAWRDTRMREVYVREVGSHPNSLHFRRLAIDLNLFKDGRWLTQSEDHWRFGVFWERLHPLCRWGGRFGDGNHYSIEHEGIK